MNKKAIIILAVTFFLILGTVPKIIRFAENRNSEEQKFTVYYETPSHNAAIPDIELSGELKPYYSAQIYSKIDGLLKNRYVNLGDKVRKGQLLATIDAPVTDSDKISAESGLNAAQKALIEAEYKLNYAKETFERYKNASNAISVQELKSKEIDYNSAQMEYRIAKANVQTAQSQLRRASELKKYEEIAAPFDGIVTNYNVDAGSNIVAGGSSTSTVLFEISQVDKLRLRADIPQSYLNRIKNGEEIKFYVPEKPNKIYTGKIERIQKSLDSTSRTMKIEIITPNKNEELFAGLYVRIIIPSKEPSGKNLLIKNEYVITDSFGTRVLTVENNKLHFIPVEIGNDYGEVVEIVKGLKGNEKIVTNYNDSLTEAQQVIAKERTQNNK